MASVPLVLITNDDGLHAPGLHVLWKELVSAGARAVVVAPEKNHTAFSHSITLTGRLEVTQQDHSFYVCNGTPADCVRIGILGSLFERPDLVVSGINNGANAGEDVHYSGTVAAAVESAMLGIPAVAVSKDGDGGDIPFLSGNPATFGGAAYAVRVALAAHRVGIPEQTLINVNLPKDFDPGLGGRWSRLGQRRWAEARMAVLEREDCHALIDPWAEEPAAVFDEGTDYWRLRAGYASLTPLSTRGGLHDATAELEAWASSLSPSIEGQESPETPMLVADGPHKATN